MIKLNNDPEIVASLKDALEQTGGYCPCVIAPTEDDKCMCKAFREQIADPEFEGFCHCGLYEKVKEDNMAIESTELCPHCGAEFDYVAESITDKVKCPECGELTMQCNMCEEMSCSNCIADLTSCGKGVM